MANRKQGGFFQDSQEVDQNLPENRKRRQGRFHQDGSSSVSTPSTSETSPTQDVERRTPSEPGGAASTLGEHSQGGVYQTDPAITVVSTVDQGRLYEGGVNPNTISSFDSPQGGFHEHETRGARGPKGDTGEQGPAGPQGIKGDTGDTGADGPRGPAGPQGDPGQIGPRGPEGPAGMSITGPVGPAGPQGDTGPRGEPGAQGDPGQTGQTGSRGPIGPAGPQGPKGDTGAAGAAGAEDLGDLTSVTIGTAVDGGTLIQDAVGQWTNGRLSISDVAEFDPTDTHATGNVFVYNAMTSDFESRALNDEEIHQFRDIADNRDQLDAIIWRGGRWQSLSLTEVANLFTSDQARDFRVAIGASAGDGFQLSTDSFPVGNTSTAVFAQTVNVAGNDITYYVRGTAQDANPYAANLELNRSNSSVFTPLTGATVLTVDTTTGTFVSIGEATPATGATIATNTVTYNDSAPFVGANTYNFEVEVNGQDSDGDDESVDLRASFTRYVPEYVMSTQPSAFSDFTGPREPSGSVTSIASPTFLVTTSDYGTVATGNVQGFPVNIPRVATGIVSDADQAGVTHTYNVYRVPLPVGQTTSLS